MKKLIPLLIFLITISNLNYAQTSNFSIFTKEGEPFKMYLNSELINENSASNVAKDEIHEGRYVVKIDFDDLYINNIVQTINISAGYDISFIIKKNKKGEYLLRGFSMTEQKKESYNNNNNGYNGNNNNGYNGNNNNGYNGNNGTITFDDNTSEADFVDDFFKETATNISTAFSYLGSELGNDFNVHNHLQNKMYVDNGYTTNNRPTGCSGLMDNYHFSEAKKMIASQTFDSDKENTAMQIIAANCLYSQQVKEIIELFSHESTKLDVAKFAYHHTFDIGNYFLVNSAFTFSMTQDELSSYINSLK